MDKIKYYNLDFSNFSSMLALFMYMNETLEFPDWCGHNLSALWDMLTGFVGDIDVTIRNGNKNKDFYDYIEKIIGIFKRAEEEYGNVKVTIIE